MHLLHWLKYSQCARESKKKFLVKKELKRFVRWSGEKKKKTLLYRTALCPPNFPAANPLREKREGGYFTTLIRHYPCSLRVYNLNFRLDATREDKSPWSKIKLISRGTGMILELWHVLETVVDQLERNGWWNNKGAWERGKGECTGHLPVSQDKKQNLENLGVPS